MVVRVPAYSASSTGEHAVALATSVTLDAISGLFRATPSHTESHPDAAAEEERENDQMMKLCKTL